MGIFSSFKKPKNDDDLVASDDWLMGLADGDAASLADLAAGPNGVNSYEGTADRSSEPVPAATPAVVDEPSQATWHFPDLDNPEQQVLGDVAGTTDPGAIDATDRAFAPPMPESIQSPVPSSPEAKVLLEILGVEPDASWSEVSAAHAAAIAEYNAAYETDPERIALAETLRREMNTTYATLRLISAR